MTENIPFPHLKPLILLADSQLLFLKKDGRPYLQRLHQLFPGQNIENAAYIGASNGDQSEFFDMFATAMGSIDVPNCRHIKNDVNDDDLNYLEQADVILLAGGDIHLGWQFITKLTPHLLKARQNGAVIIGTSAGAIQLGCLGWYDKAQLSNTDLFTTLQFIPAVFSAHEEQPDWPLLRQVVSKTGGCLPGIGIPAGGGVIVTSDNSLQAIRKPMINLIVKDNKLLQEALWQLRLNHQ